MAMPNLTARMRGLVACISSSYAINLASLYVVLKLLQELSLLSPSGQLLFLFFFVLRRRHLALLLASK